MGGYYRVRLALISSVFFVFGYFIRRYWTKLNKKMIATGSIIALLFGMFLEMENTRVIYSKEIFGDPVLAFGSAMLSIIALFGIFYWIEKNVNNRIGEKLITSFAFWGRNSIVVLCTHLIFIYMIRVLEKILKMQIHTFPIIGGFFIVIVAEFLLIKFMPKSCWKLFGK